MRKRYDIVIVGGGQAGAQAAVLLRQQGYGGSIAIVGKEPDLPYDRPPLSKEYLSGTKPFERMLLRSAEAWRERDVEVHTGVDVTAVDPVEHSIRTADGRAVGYGQLVWAAGGSARALPCAGGDASGFHAVRTRADVDRILAALADVRTVAIIGGGYIGLEVAAALRAMDRQVVLIEAQDRVLERVAGEPLSRFYEAEHRARGVDIRLGTSVKAVERDGEALAGLHLSDGSFLPARMAIVGIGIVPDVAPLAAAGAEVGNGVRVDTFCRTSLPDIFAIGDCAEHRNAFAGDAWVRVESIQNANDQAMTVAKAICGTPEPYRALPWFWSNQYELKLQTVGLSQGHDDLIVRGDPATRSFSVVYLRRGRVIALDCVNCARDYSHGRALVASGAAADAAAIADPSIALRSLLTTG